MMDTIIQAHPCTGPPSRKPRTSPNDRSSEGWIRMTEAAWPSWRYFSKEASKDHKGTLDETHWFCEVRFETKLLSSVLDVGVSC